MEKIRTPLIIIVSVLIGAFGFMTYESISKTSIVPTKTPADQSSVIVPSENNLSQTVSSTITPANNSWSTYECVPLGFSISYPNDIPPKKQAETIVFSKWGPSQKADTEFYDGLSLDFSTGYIETTLEDAVNQKLQEVKTYPTFVSASEIRATTLAGRAGYSFEAVTMGRATYILVKKSDKEYLQIINSTIDPTNSGFAEIVSQMLASLKII